MNFEARIISFVVCLGAVALVAPLGADDAADKIKKGISTELENAGKKLAENVSKIIDGNLKALRELQASELKQRDEKIAKLEGDLKQVQKQLADVQAALKAATAEKVAKKKEEKKPEKPVELTKAFLGVDFAAPADDVRAKLKLTEGIGVQVSAVLPGGPAEKAGLKEGDVVVKVGDQDVGDKSFVAAIRTRKPGDKVKLSALRGEEKVDAEVTLGNRDEEVARAEKLAAAPPEKPAPPPKVYLGLLVEETDGGQLVVQEVEPEFTAAAAKLEIGDALLAVNGQPAKTLDDLKAAFDKLKVGEPFSIDFKRGEKVTIVEVTGGAEKGAAKLVSTKEAAPPAPKPARLGASIVDENGKVELAVVRAGSAAGAFGLKEGDVLVSINGEAVATVADVVAKLKGKVSGDKIDLTARRGDDSIQLKGVQLGGEGEEVKAPEDFKAIVTKIRVKGYLGFQAEESADDGVVLVNSVVAGGPAEGKLQKGDVLLKANGVEVKNLDDAFNALAGKFVDDEAKLSIRRGDKDMEVSLTYAPIPE